MQKTDFDWHHPYVIPSNLSFRTTPAGGLQVNGWAGDPTLEVPRDWVPLILAFARSRTAEAAYEAATEDWEVDRETFQQLLETWTEQGLLRPAGTIPGPQTPSRLALFRRATEGGGPRRAPIRSHFPLQRPLEFYPGLNTREIHDGERFPWVAVLEDAFPILQGEFTRLAESGSSFSTVYRAQTSTGEWAASYLWAFGQKVEETCRLCPETVRILSSIPGVAEFGTTMYSGLAPHTQITPHFGYSNAKLRCQLPLRVPGRCKLKVGDQEIEQREGKCIVFDDSFLHSAWNDSDEPRFVLVFDFFHPDLTPEEVQYLARLVTERQMAKGHLGQRDTRQKVGWVGSDGQAGEEAAEHL